MLTSMQRTLSRLMPWIALVLYWVQANKTVVQIEILDAPIVDPNRILNVVANSTGSVSLTINNVTLIPGACYTGYWWNGSACLECACTTRDAYPQSVVDFALLI